MKKSLDYENVTQVILQIEASDQGTPKRLSNSTMVTINVTDVNDETPTFVQPPQSINVSENEIKSKLSFLNSFQIFS